MRRISALRYVFLGHLRLVSSLRKASRALNCLHLRILRPVYAAHFIVAVSRPSVTYAKYAPVGVFTAS